MRETGLSRFGDYKRVNRSDFNYLVYQPLIRDLEFAIGNYATGRLIDIGCGNKPYEGAFQGRVSEYIGCDIVQSNLQKVDVICEANNIPLPDMSFDSAFSTQAIEHVFDHQGLVNEAYRLLKPGGHFILSGPFYWHLHEEPYDFFRFTKHGFHEVLKKAGFDVIETLSNGGMWALTGQTLIHSFQYSQSRNFFVKTWRYLFAKLRLHRVVNRLFGWLDRVDHNPINTINYVMVAQKPR